MTTPDPSTRDPYEQPDHCIVGAVDMGGWLLRLAAPEDDMSEAVMYWLAFEIKPRLVRLLEEERTSRLGGGDGHFWRA